MSLLSTSSFDDNSTVTLEYSSDSTAVITPGAGRKGTAGVVTDGTTYFTLDRGTYGQSFESLELFRAIAFKLDEIPAATQTILQFQEADNTDQVCIALLNTGVVRALRGNTGGSTLASSVDPILVDVYYYLEVRVFIDNAAGRVVVKLWTDADTSATIIDFTGDTLNGGTGLLAKVKHGLGLEASWDDAVLMDAEGSAFNAFLGNKHVEAHAINDAGFYTTWEPFPPGSLNWENVAEIPPDGNTTYNYAPDGTKDTFAFTPTTATTVNGVMVKLCARVSEAGHTVGAVLRQADTDSDSLGNEPSTDFLTYQYPYETAPDSGSWTQAKFNATEAGYALDAEET